MKLVLLGPPGAGKGTHAKVMSEKYKVAHLAAGDILRKNIREETELGLKAKDIIESGGLVSDDLVNLVMFDEIRAVGLEKGFILDGYPRTIGQAEALDKFLENENFKVDCTLNFDTSKGMIITRLSGRRVCPKCSANYHMTNIPPKKEGICDECGSDLIQRKDDTPETIEHRLEMYEKETFPLIDYYEKKGVLKKIPGDFEVPELQEEIRKLFEELNLLS